MEMKDFWTGGGGIPIALLDPPNVKETNISTTENVLHIIQRQLEALFTFIFGQKFNRN